MRTTLNIDDSVARDLIRYTDAKTKTEAVNKAITEWVRCKRIEEFRALGGTIEWEGDLEKSRALETVESEHLHG